MTQQQWQEAPSIKRRRATRERLLEKVGVCTPEGQRLLDKWWRQDQATRTSARKDEEQ